MKTLPSNFRGEHPTNKSTLIKELTIGVIGGLAGTIVMDLFGVAMILLLQGAPTISFSIIGDAAAGGIALLGIQIAGGVPLGAVLHYGIGLVLGVLFVALVTRVAAFRLDTALKSMGLGIVFVELMSLPMLAGAAIILAMTTNETVQWFGMSFVMHLVYGGVLGLYVGGRLQNQK